MTKPTYLQSKNERIWARMLPVHLASVKGQDKKHTENLLKQLLCTTGDSEDILLSVIHVTLQNVQEVKQQKLLS